jgi:hypothetical protein
MPCPHCSHDNAAGRKYCRACAKPLALGVVPAKPALPQRPAAIAPVALPPRVSALAHRSVLNPMAVASLALSFLAFLLPLGIASVVLGHLSRAQIAQSDGRQTGAGLACVGLIISYLQFVVVGLLGLGLGAVWHRMNQELDHNEFARAAMVEQIKHGGRPSAADVAKHRQDAVDAMRLVHASESDYLAGHPDEGYACDFYRMGWDGSSPNELSVHMLNSRYDIKIYQCGRFDQARYAAVAIPRSDSNPPNSPVYCVDQTGVVRSSSGDSVNQLNRILLLEHKACPEFGQAVE